MIVFPDSHVDLMGNITFTRQQLIKRWDQELERKWSEPVQTNLRDFMQIKASLDPLTFPNYAENEALLTAFIADKQTCYLRRIADEAKSDLLVDTLAYEAAVQRKVELELLINGREAVDEVLDEFGVVITPAVEAVEPMPVTIEGEDNPAYTQAVADLAEADAVIAGASESVLSLAQQRLQ